MTLPDDWAIKNPDHEDVLAAQKYTSDHRKAIGKSTICGCFYCLSTFKPDEIKEWIDNNQTALCPKCGIDSVLGEFSGYPITPEFLEAMKQHWFDKDAVTLKMKGGKVVEVTVADKETEDALEAFGFFGD